VLVTVIYLLEFVKRNLVIVCLDLRTLFSAVENCSCFVLHAQI